MGGPPCSWFIFLAAAFISVQRVQKNGDTHIVGVRFANLIYATHVFATHVFATHVILLHHVKVTGCIFLLNLSHYEGS